MKSIRDLYAEADRLLAGWSCEGSTDCCHFGRTGREPHLWPSEWELVRQAIARRGVALSQRSQALRVVAADDDGDEAACPLLSVDGRCTIYDDRPFGCRTFFCERGVGPTRKPPRTELSSLGRKIADLDRSGSGPRPLSRWLELAGRPRRS